LFADAFTSNERSPVVGAVNLTSPPLALTVVLHARQELIELARERAGRAASFFLVL